MIAPRKIGSFLAPTWKKKRNCKREGHPTKNYSMVFVFKEFLLTESYTEVGMDQITYTFNKYIGIFMLLETTLELDVL